MKFYLIIKNTPNAIINTYANKNLLLSDIINYSSPDTHYTIIFESQGKYIHLDMDSILQNINCLEMSIGNFANFVCKDEYVKLYECKDSLHPNLNKCLYGFSLGDIIDQSDIKFYDPSNAQYTKNFFIESATDLVIEIKNKQNNKLIPVFDENIMFNGGNDTHVIIKNMRNTIINEYNQLLPINKFHFLDLQPFGNSVTITKLDKIEYEINNNILNIPNIQDIMFGTKSCMVILDKKFIPWKLIKFNNGTIKINLNHLTTLKAFQNYTIDELLSDYHSFIILFKDNMFTNVLNGISDITSNSGDIYTIWDFPLNSIYFLDMMNYGFVFPTFLKVMLEDINAQILFDEVYRNPFEPAESFREHYDSKFVRTHVVTNYTTSQNQNLIPLYENPDIYISSRSQFGYIDNQCRRFIPIRFIFSH